VAAVKLGGYDTAFIAQYKNHDQRYEQEVLCILFSRFAFATIIILIFVVVKIISILIFVVVKII
jgi:hypothetical protein